MGLLIISVYHTTVKEIDRERDRDVRGGRCLKCNTTTIVMKRGRDLLDNRRAGLKSGTFCNHIYQQYLEGKILEKNQK
jgi:hypothetical protein